VNRPYHIPVLAEEVISLLQPHPGQIFVDGTLGGGGHASRIAEHLQPGGTLVVIDQDPTALEAGQAALSALHLTIIPIHGNFRNMRSLLDAHGIGKVSGILLDLGVSSHQLDAGERGFSFRMDARLDMRMDPTQGETAGEWLERASEAEITRVLWDYGEERWAARIAKFIIEQRQRSPIATTKQLADLVSAAIPKKAQPRDIHPATRAFQGIRIHINDELGALQTALQEGIDCLAAGGRIGVISYHSLEDRMVKQAFVRLTGRCQCPPGLPICQCNAKAVVTLVTRKSVVPGEAEIKANPRSRSARLRVAEKLLA
jgi:16S rRNA (cytosine1402-N4)-methyltransferase